MLQVHKPGLGKERELLGQVSVLYVSVLLLLLLLLLLWQISNFIENY
jgi:hypothetical protein